MAKEIKKSPSISFLEKKEIIKHEIEAEKIKHQLKMEELEFFRESDRLHHERELERGRIKSAEIRRTLQHKDAQKMFKMEN